MSKLSLILLASLAPLAAACGSTSDAAPAPAKPTAADDSRATCITVMERNRACTDDYIPALVDARARHDNPRGIAEAVKTDRDAVIAEARGEWAEDSKDEAIGRTCDAMIQQIQRVGAGDLETSRGCLAREACGDYVSCVLPQFEKHFTK
jgi:hypothetical protein